MFAVSAKLEIRTSLIAGVTIRILCNSGGVALWAWW